MKPFNLEEAKAGKPVCTRDGKPVRILCYDLKDKYPIVVIHELDDGTECILTHTTTGKTHQDEQSPTDLFMKPEKKEGWINIYNPFVDYHTASTYIYQTFEDAYKSRASNYISTIKIEWEE